MEHPSPIEPLHEIETRWSDVLRAHQDELQAHSARERMVLRYIGAVRHYIAGLLHDEVAAEELAQEFAVRVLRGDFRGADPDKGRFRDYVKAAAFDLVRDYRRALERPAVGPHGGAARAAGARCRSRGARRRVPPELAPGVVPARWGPWPSTRSRPVARTTTSSTSGPASPIRPPPNWPRN